MRIGVDLSPLRPPLTGIGNYELHLLGALLGRTDAPHVEGFGLFGWSTVDKKYLTAVELASSQIHLAGLRKSPGERIRRLMTTGHTIRRIYGATRRYAFKRQTVSKVLSAFHAFGYMAPGETSAPLIPVVYDVSFVQFPDAHPPERVRMLRSLGKQLQSAAAVHTISRFSAREISEIFGVPASRIAVIYPGVNPSFLAFPKQNSDQTLAHYALRCRGYFLTVSTLEPRKNLRSLIQAYSSLPGNLRERIPLCVVGARGWGGLDLPAGAAALEREGSLRFMGFLPNEQLRALYANALAMFYPSVYEGFGMPIIEALACGANVICSDTTSMPEAAGNVARRVAPLDIDGWFREMQRAAEHPPDTAESVEKRQQHAGQFTWARAASQTMDLYKRVAR